MVKILVAVVLLAHGIGHVLGPLQVFKVTAANPTWNGNSWLLTDVTGQTVSNVIGLALWIAAMVGFVAAAAVVMGWLPASWWVPLAVGSSIVSLVAIALFPSAFPMTSTVAAAVVDVAGHRGRSRLQVDSDGPPGVSSGEMLAAHKGRRRTMMRTVVSRVSRRAVSGTSSVRPGPACTSRHASAPRPATGSVGATLAAASHHPDPAARGNGPGGPLDRLDPHRRGFRSARAATAHDRPGWYAVSLTARCRPSRGSGPFARPDMTDGPMEKRPLGGQCRCTRRVTH